MMWKSTHLEDVYKGLTARNRPTPFEYGLMQAIVASTRATCSRAKNGAVIVREGRVVASGYNGSLSGQPHCDHTCNCRGRAFSQSPGHTPFCLSQQPCLTSVHAEHNAILFAARNGVRTEGAAMYCTMMPCQGCARAIVQAGIFDVYYLIPYRDTQGKSLLKTSGVNVFGYASGIETKPASEALL